MQEAHIAISGEAIRSVYGEGDIETV